VKPRDDVYRTYWYFASERQKVFFRRLENAPQPWSLDPIISEYKFCNTFRASDRVSQFLIKNVIYSGPQEEEEVLFRILLFKIFNTIETWQYLESMIGSITLSSFCFELFGRLLEERQLAGNSIYTSAYMSCASKAYGYNKKHWNHLALIKQICIEDNLSKKVTRAKSFRSIYDLLIQYPLLGRFMSYQLAIDINYSELVNFSENDFTVAGPGALRGIAKCFSDTKDRDSSYVIQWMADNQKREFDRLGISFPNLWGRYLHLIDCQNLFCEVDKYTRVAIPELKSNRKRIKSKFHPNYNKIELFYPPKWGINSKIVTTGHYN
jgi:hypothetical protein